MEKTHNGRCSAHALVTVAWPSWSKALDLRSFLIPNGRKSARVRTSPLPAQLLYAVRLFDPFQLLS